MRIERLYMKNFAPLFSALDRKEVLLDYRDVKSKVINIFIGKMGSCKTFLLSHHQPFATLGTLDVRNSEDMILPGKRGLKEIDYRRGKDLYEIKHFYVPTKTNHTVKSYVMKNGVELNENGNVSSFKVVIETEFGLDQNYLKLFRIGDNVTNLPDMGPTERKSFVSSMLTETDIYTFLYKKIGDENRSLNAQLSMLINRIRAISDRTPDQLKADLALESELAVSIEKESQRTNQELYRREAVIDNLLKGKTIDGFRAEMEIVRRDYLKAQEESSSLFDDLEQIKDHPSLNEIGMEMSGINGRIGIRSKNIMSLSMEIESLDKQLSSIKDKLAVLGSSDHIETLRSTYNQLMGTIAEYEKKLARFSYGGSLTSILAIISELSSVDGLIKNLAQYNIDAVRDILRNSGKALGVAKRELSRLHRERERSQQEMSNMTNVSMYHSTHVMMRPFNCPTKDCPYFKYHPDTEKRTLTSDQIDSTYLKHRNRLMEIDAKINFYDEFPNIANRLSMVRSAWNRVKPVATELEILLEDDLAEAITNPLHAQWYDATKLYSIKELCGIREKYYELMDRVASMRNTLNIYEVSDIDTLQRNYTEMSQQLKDSTDRLQLMETEHEMDNARLVVLRDLSVKISRAESLEAMAKETSERASELQLKSQQMEVDDDMIKNYSGKIGELRAISAEQKAAYRLHMDTINKIERKLSDIQYTTEQYQEACEKQEILKDILDAVSSRKGIPLAFIRSFLADCKDIINDLISNVFADKIEIQKFDIPDDGVEFNIPYTRNGALISDITKASQGERAVISIALSFALIRQGDFPYNIMLLDEMDAPLYKEDRSKFIEILLRQLTAIGAEQVFIISHNNTFDGYNVNIIMTSDEVVDENPLTSVMRIS